MTEKKTEYMQVKLTPAEKKVLKELSDDSGISMADILRRPIIDELQRRRQMERKA